MKLLFEVNIFPDDHQVRITPKLLSELADEISLVVCEHKLISPNGVSCKPRDTKEPQ